jgi:hypothetical protein
MAGPEAFPDDLLPFPAVEVHDEGLGGVPRELTVLGPEGATPYLVVVPGSERDTLLLEVHGAPEGSLPLNAVVIPGEGVYVGQVSLAGVGLGTGQVRVSGTAGGQWVSISSSSQLISRRKTGLRLVVYETIQPSSSITKRRRDQQLIQGAESPTLDWGTFVQNSYTAVNDPIVVDRANSLNFAHSGG